MSRRIVPRISLSFLINFALNSPPNAPVKRLQRRLHGPTDTNDRGGPGSGTSKVDRGQLEDISDGFLTDGFASSRPWKTGRVTR
jgi:hypothetical protein